ncbi:MAG: bifunctional nuclease family protein [Spirochaetia bacterium]|nr:bifunctional nuclease family protein [Spirochaetia bacterium]
MSEENHPLPEGLLEVKISDVSITNVGFAIFMKPVGSTSSKVVPIFIGPLETYSISSALDGVTPPRPNTHDLIINLISELEARILHVIINDIIGNIFYARVVIQSGDGIVEIDARPSDSVAIAIRAKCPIFMHEKVYQEAGVVIGDEGKPETPENEEEQIITTSATSQTPIEQLKIRLQRAIDQERFEEAADLRDQITKMQREN